MMDCKKICIVGLIILVMGTFGTIGQATPQISGNVPLDSYVYGYLEKLDGLGLMRDMLPGARPYSRTQVKAWVDQMSAAAEKKQNLPQFAKQMLAELKRDFADLPKEPQFRQATLGVVSSDGDDGTYAGGIAAPYRVFGGYNNGYGWKSGTNVFGSFLWEGLIGSDAWLSLTPRFSWNDSNTADASLESGYLALRKGNAAFYIGKDAMSWGQGRMGNLMLTNNATPLTAIRVANIEPLHYRGLLSNLGDIRATGFVSVLDDRKKYKDTDVDQPGLVGLRIDLQPAPDFTIGAGYMSMFGGKGIPMYFGDFVKLLTGKTNAWQGETDKWNGMAGVDFRWRIPRWNGMQVYGEYYLEDNIDGFYAANARMIGVIGGIYIPRLDRDGMWDLNLEFASTASAWYVHGLYTGGWTYGGNLLGDTMGGNAHRYSIRLGFTPSSDTQMALNLQRVNQGINLPLQQRTDALWLTLRQRVGHDLFLACAGGWAKRNNADFVIGQSKPRKFVSMEITQTF